MYLIQYFRRCLNEENNEFFFHSDINLAYLYIFVYIYIYIIIIIICIFTLVFID